GNGWGGCAGRKTPSARTRPRSCARPRSPPTTPRRSPATRSAWRACRVDAGSGRLQRGDRVGHFEAREHPAAAGVARAVEAERERGAFDFGGELVGALERGFGDDEAVLASAEVGAGEVEQVGALAARLQRLARRLHQARIDAQAADADDQ